MLRFRHRTFFQEAVESKIGQEAFAEATVSQNDSASIGMVPRRSQRGSERPRCAQEEKTSPAKSFVKKMSNSRQPTAFPVF